MNATRRDIATGILSLLTFSIGKKLLPAIGSGARYWGPITHESSTTFYVDSENGSDEYVGDSPIRAFKTLAAMSAALAAVPVNNRQRQAIVLIKGQFNEGLAIPNVAGDDKAFDNVAFRGVTDFETQEGAWVGIGGMTAPKTVINGRPMRATNWRLRA